ncbi:hypothetical protein ACFQVA_31455 [Actinomadura keratinilytica]
MGFTIGGIRDIRSGIRRRGRTADRLALAELSGRWGWDVVPGARATADGCSCGTQRCAAPGAHPSTGDGASRRAPRRTTRPGSGPRTAGRR